MTFGYVNDSGSMTEGFHIDQKIPRHHSMPQHILLCKIDFDILSKFEFFVFLAPSLVPVWADEAGQ